METADLFKHGTTWLKADFHLHTRRDKEFKYTGKESYFASKYIQALKRANIQIGVITNHNKFDFDEYRELRKRALKEDILLLPGVELSVNDGAKGIHVLVVFSEEWVQSGRDFINPFLATTFMGKIPEEYERENGRSNDNLIETIKKLEAYRKDFFLVCAHVEQNNGLWKELEGGRLEDLGKNPLFQDRTLGFQKVRTIDSTKLKNTRGKCRTKVKNWLSDWYPAEVEGSDCKSLDQIGKGRSCYLKIGGFTFESVKYALTDYQKRVSTEQQEYGHSHIRSITFDGGRLNNQTIHFSPELNTMIGVRGSGKSSILEAIRYTLDIPFGLKSQDTDYKQNLVWNTLRDGGKATIHAIDHRGQKYEIHRIVGQQPDVYVDGHLQPGVAIRQTILRKPIYFGQKDLSSTGEGFEKDLVEKLIGEKLHSIREKIEQQKQRVQGIVEHLEKLSSVNSRIEEYRTKQQDAEFRLKFYHDHGVEEKLQKQIDFETDSRRCSKIEQAIEKYIKDLETALTVHEEDLKSQTSYQSNQNEAFFSDLFTGYGQLLGSFETIREESKKSQRIHKDIQNKIKQFDKQKNGLKEEFAEMERNLSEELRTQGAQAVRLEEFHELGRTVEICKQVIVALKTQQRDRKQIKESLLKELDKLESLWFREFQVIHNELEKVNGNDHSLNIQVEYKGDKKSFAQCIREYFRGSGKQEKTFQKIAESVSDFSELYKSRETISQSEYFIRNLKSLLTWQVPNRFTITYHNKELKQHSLGQRASSLILFVLSQRDNDLILIDQPEDDLDNQTIYEDVIKLILELKPSVQFIFATHNANFPVLGDAEQVFSCDYNDKTMNIAAGSIDNPLQQKEVVNIMEGGKEAFNRRKEIYQTWR